MVRTLTPPDRPVIRMNVSVRVRSRNRLEKMSKICRHCGELVLLVNAHHAKYHADMVLVDSDYVTPLVKSPLRSRLCPFCGLRVTPSDTRKHHLDVHSQPFICFPLAITTSDEADYQCRWCGTGFHEERPLIQHIQTRHRAALAAVCKSYPQLADYYGGMQHVGNVAPTNCNDAPPRDEGSKIMCVICRDFVATSDVAMKDHLERSHRRVMRTCPSCCFVFKVPYLFDHVKMCSKPSRGIRCCLCEDHNHDLFSNSARAMFKHMRSHGRENSCTICNMNHVNEHGLKQHLFVHETVSFHYEQQIVVADEERGERSTGRGSASPAPTPDLACPADAPCGGAPSLRLIPEPLRPTASCQTRPSATETSVSGDESINIDRQEEKKEPQTDIPTQMPTMETLWKVRWNGNMLLHYERHHSDSKLLSRAPDFDPARSMQCPFCGLRLALGDVRDHHLTHHPTMHVSLDKHPDPRSGTGSFRYKVEVMPVQSARNPNAETTTSISPGSSRQLIAGASSKRSSQSSALPRLPTLLGARDVPVDEDDIDLELSRVEADSAVFDAPFARHVERSHLTDLNQKMKPNTVKIEKCYQEMEEEPMCTDVLVGTRSIMKIKHEPTELNSSPPFAQTVLCKKEEDNTTSPTPTFPQPEKALEGTGVSEPEASKFYVKLEPVDTADESRDEVGFFSNGACSNASGYQDCHVRLEDVLRRQPSLRKRVLDDPGSSVALDIRKRKAVESESVVVDSTTDYVIASSYGYGGHVTLRSGDDGSHHCPSYDNGAFSSAEDAVTGSTESAVTESTESAVTEGTESAVTESTEPAVTGSTESAVTESTEPAVTESTESAVTEGTEMTVRDRVGVAELARSGIVEPSASLAAGTSGGPLIALVKKAQEVGDSSWAEDSAPHSAVDSAVDTSDTGPVRRAEVQELILSRVRSEMRAVYDPKYKSKRRTFHV